MIALPHSITIEQVAWWRRGARTPAAMTVYVKPSLRDVQVVVEMRDAPARVLAVSLTDAQMAELRRFFRETACPSGAA